MLRFQDVASTETRPAAAVPHLGSRRPRVVIVGCGFGGLFAARALQHAPVELIVIDRNNYHLFQPLLYQVASAALTPADIAQPIRKILRGQHNSFVMLGNVERVSLEARCVFLGGECITYDYLILAPGAVDNYFDHPEWKRFAPGMKEVEDATYIRSRLLLSFEAAEIEADPAERAAHLTFVIIGGGPTGVELAGAIKELAVDVIPKEFHHTDTRRARVVLLEAGPRLLPALHPDSSRRALEQLQELGVEVHLNERVTNVLPDGVQTSAQKLRSHNVIWAAGVRASALVESLGVELAQGGRVKVEADCSIPGHPEAFVIGDAAYMGKLGTDWAVPGVSQGALQMGKYVARVITDEVTRRDDTRRKLGFRYKDYGSMATIGKSRAVVEIGRLRFGGLLAWLAWMALHITVLIGFRNRLGVLAEWIYNYVFFKRGSRLITGLDPAHVKDLLMAPQSSEQRTAGNDASLAERNAAGSQADSAPR